VGADDGADGGGDSECREVGGAEPVAKRQLSVDALPGLSLLLLLLLLLEVSGTSIGERGDKECGG